MAFKIDTSTAAGSMPPPAAAGTPGWFSDGNPGLGVPGTVVSADWLNSVQGEITNVIAAASIALDKTKTDQLLSAIKKLARTKLLSNLTIYVATTGNDTTGDGTNALPFASLNRAYQYLLSSFDLNGFTATIQVANGTYNQGFNAYAPPLGAFNGPVVIQGNVASPSSCIINVTNDICINCYNTGVLIIKGFKLIATGTSGTYSTQGVGILATGATTVLFRNMEFGTCGFAHLYSSYNAFIGLIDGTSAATIPYTISGGSQFHYIAADNSVTTIVGAQVTLTGTPAFSTAFAYATFGQLNVFGTTFTGSATGVRYIAANLGAVNTNGGGASYFPGNASGTASANSLYI